MGCIFVCVFSSEKEEEEAWETFEKDNPHSTAQLGCVDPCLSVYKYTASAPNRR